jgi:UDP-glucose 4-epimerase
MKVFITGGAGFIGSHFAEYFQKLGDEITILDNFSTGSSKNLELIDFSGEMVHGDIRDSEIVEPLIKKSDLVLHMAAALGVDTIMSDTIKSISTNIYGSEIILQAASKYKKRIVIASTSEIYGKNSKQPLSEDDDRVIGTPQNFRWSYSDAKAIEESIARVLFLEKKLPVTTVRFFNTIGPRQTGKYGMVVPKFIASALKGEDVNVYGEGKQTRVFCHVSDAISGVVSLLNNDKSIGEVFNIGGVGEISILDLADKVIKLTGSASKVVKIPYENAYPEGYEDMQRRVPDISKIEKYTNWKPQFNLDQAIVDILENR